MCGGGECVYNIVKHCPTGNKHINISVISGFCREVNDICVLLAHYAVYGGNFFLTFWDGCPETSVRNHHNTLHNVPEERRYHKNTCSK